MDEPTSFLSVYHNLVLGHMEKRTVSKASLMANKAGASVTGPVFDLSFKLFKLKA